ncbi:MAG: PadR family transcriptional regulator [Turicibacter sp.]|nr:PadR family transcriptional regulator [Turicibacter sp.]
MQNTAIVQGFIVDLRRGTLVLAVLSCLNTAKYGYSLLQEMESGGVKIEANTLYPLLRRLESQGLLESEWNTSQSRPRKYYTISQNGKKIYQLLRAEWQRIVADMESLLNRNEVLQ